jgi:demethylmenaquinone methyltransferase/2-methoxy-6-polyprenyl-1,4-benzoquinol methylase
VPVGFPSTELVRGIFTDIADRYDLLNSLTSLGTHRAWRRRQVREAALEPGCKVLDLAAGTGALSIELARDGRAGEVLATDFVPQMLAVAKRKAASRTDLSPLRFDVQDAQALDLSDAAYDVVTIAFGIRNLPRRDANMREVLRVLKPGGRYLILEFSTPHAAFRPIYYIYLKTVVPLLGALFASDPASYRYLHDSIRQFPPQTALAQELRDSGFREVYWRDLMFGIVALHVATK